MKKFSVLLSLLLLSTTIFADEIKLSLEDFSKQQDTITTTQEITQEEIESKHSNQAMDVLQNTTGVFVQKTADMGRSDPVIRGFGDSCRKIFVAIDGKPEYMSLFGCGVSHSILSGNIDRIEITKGPDSVLYGSGALGGAINIITKMPTKPFEGNINVSIGSFNTQNSKIWLGGIQDNIFYEFSANKAASDGHLENSQYNATDLYEKLGYIFKDGGVVKIQAKQYSGLTHYPKPASGGNWPANYWEDYHRYSLQADYNKLFSRSELSLKIYENWGEHKFSTNFHSKDSLIGALANYDIEIGEKDILKTGAEFRQQEGKLVDKPVPSPMKLGSWKTSSWAIFALDKHNFTDNFSAVAGARYNNDEISGDFVAARAGLEYEFIKDMFLKGLYSRAFRSPYLNELYLLPTSNENLKPEVINNYEVGFDIKKEDFTFNITGFVMKGDNLIQVEKGKFRNAGDYEFKGSEIVAGYVFNKYVNAKAGYTYFNAGKHTQGRPEQKIDTEVNFKVNKWSLTLNGMYVGEYYAADNKQNRLNDFTVVNAKLAYEVNTNIKLFVNGQNLTNQDYEIFIDRQTDAFPVMQMPGAAVYFGTEIKF
ncbi:TonB-dependent receptor [Candidatus Ruminimicrobium bovinum]|uniref:TonB-dependent receptor n=1 Tax=Candidatus Ruminimicrobium bovinum TaxID=3242779 RepID=UPI0039B8601A